VRDRVPGGRRVILAVGLLATLSACGSRLDERRATLCRRAVPAIVPEGTTASILRIATGASSDSIRVDYRLNGRPDAPTKAHWIVCGFGPGAMLESVATETGPMNGASVYLLRHYYLDTPEAAAADPGGR